jgi:hypothetical protein
MRKKRTFRTFFIKISLSIIAFVLLTAYTPFNNIKDSYRVPKVYLSFLMSGKYDIAYNYLNQKEGLDQLTFEKYVSIIKKTIELDKIYYQKKGFNFIRRSFQVNSFEIISHVSINNGNPDNKTEVYQVSYNFEDTLQNSGQRELFSVITWNIVSTFYVKDLKIKHITQDYKRAVRLQKGQYI